MSQRCVRVVGSIGLGLWMTCASAAITFTDSTFNPSDYVVTTYRSDSGSPSGTTTVGQTFTGGNLGAAAETSLSGVSRSGVLFASSSYYLHKSFVYDPGAMGEITSISYSEDVWAQSSTRLSYVLGSLVLVQGGKMYIRGVALPGTQNLFQSANEANLGAESFVLITDPTTLASDASSHPSFMAGAILFGFYNGFQSITNGISQAITFDERLDNLNITLHTSSVLAPVPEPSSFLLLSGGLAALLVAKGKGRFRGALRNSR